MALKLYILGSSCRRVFSIGIFAGELEVGINMPEFLSFQQVRAHILVGICAKL